MFACGKGGYDSGARCGNLGDSEGSDEGQEILGGRMRSEVGVQGGDAGNRGRSVREGNVTAEGKVSPSAGGNGESRDNPDTVGNQPPNPTQAASKPEAPNQPDGFPANPLLIQSMSKLRQRCCQHKHRLWLYKAFHPLPSFQVRTWMQKKMDLRSCSKLLRSEHT